MIGKKKRSVTEPRPLPPRPQRLRIPPAVVIRTFVIGSVAVVACAWAIWRHYFTPRMPLVVPVPAAASAPSGSYEIPIEPP
jgi:hypothetical protein